MFQNFVHYPIPHICIFNICSNCVPDTAPSPNFKVPDEFPAVGIYDKQLPIDKSPQQYMLPVHETSPLSTVKTSLIPSGLAGD